MSCNTSPITGAFSCDSTPVDFPPSSAPAATSSHSAWDWASMIGGFGASIFQSTTAPSPTPIANRGIPTSRQPPTTMSQPSQTTGILIGVAVIALLVWLVKRVA